MFSAEGYICFDTEDVIFIGFSEVFSIVVEFVKVTVSVGFSISLLLAAGDFTIANV